MNYYINSGVSRRRTAWKIGLYVLGYVVVFALSFFVSYKLASGAQTDTLQVESLKQEVTSLTAQLTDKEERIAALELQVANIRAEVDATIERLNAEAQATAQQTETDAQ